VAAADLVKQYPLCSANRSSGLTLSDFYLRTSFGMSAVTPNVLENYFCGQNKQ